VDNVEATVVALTMCDDANTTHVTTTSDHGNGTSIELDVVENFSGVQVNLDGVIDLDERIGVSDTAKSGQHATQFVKILASPDLIQRLIDGNLRSRIMRNQVGNAALAQLDTLDFAELVLSFFSRDAVHSETTLGIVDEAEVLASLLNGDDIHEA